MRIRHKGKDFDINHDGYLINFKQFCPEWVDYCKGGQMLEDKELWILEEIREHHLERGSMPSLRYLSKKTELAPSEILSIFPDLNWAAKVAGLPSGPF